MMKRRMLGLAAALVLCALPWASANAGVFISVGIPGPWYGPYYHHHYYYGPRVIVAGPPVVIASPPRGHVYVQQPAVIYQQAPAPTNPTGPGPSSMWRHRPRFPGSDPRGWRHRW